MSFKVGHNDGDLCSSNPYRGPSRGGFSLAYSSWRTGTTDSALGACRGCCAYSGGIADGALVVLRMRLGPLNQYWVAAHRDYEEGRQFRDVQVSGPFAHWVHTHRFVSDGTFRVSCGRAHRVCASFWRPWSPGRKTFVRQKLDRMFNLPPSSRFFL